MNIYKSPATDEEIKDIAKRIPVRINTYWDKSIELMASIQFLADRWAGSAVTVVNIREDFNYSDETPLIKRRDIHEILSDDSIEWVDRTSCRVCETVYVKYTCKKGTILFGIHKGTDKTSLSLADNSIEVNDFLIYPNGDVCYDWGREYVVEIKDSSSADTTVVNKKEREKDNTKDVYSFNHMSCGIGRLSC